MMPLAELDEWKEVSVVRIAAGVTKPSRLSGIDDFLLSDDEYKTEAPLMGLLGE